MAQARRIQAPPRLLPLGRRQGISTPPYKPLMLICKRHVSDCVQVQPLGGTSSGCALLSCIQRNGPPTFNRLQLAGTIALVIRRLDHTSLPCCCHAGPAHHGCSIRRAPDQEPERCPGCGSCHRAPEGHQAGQRPASALHMTKTSKRATTRRKPNTSVPTSSLHQQPSAAIPCYYPQYSPSSCPGITHSLGRSTTLPLSTLPQHSITPPAGTRHAPLHSPQHAITPGCFTLRHTSRRSHTSC